MSDQVNEQGSSAVETASWARRVLALIVDWIASTLVVMTILGPAGWSEDRYAGMYTLVAYFLQNSLLTATMGGSFGQLLTRLRVVRANGDPRPLDPMRALLRSLLICLVIPPLVFQPDGRGLHDMAAGSVVCPFRPAG